MNTEINATIADVSALKDKLMTLKKKRGGHLSDACTIRADRDGITIIGYGEEHEKYYRAGGEVDAAGEACVNLVELYKIVSKLKKFGGDLAVEWSEDDPHHVQFKHENLEFLLDRCFHPDDLPDAPEIRDDSQHFEVNGKTLYSAFTSCAIAAATSKTSNGRRNIESVNFCADCTWATDGHRMRVFDLPFSQVEGTISIETETVKALVYALKKFGVDSAVEITVDDRYIRFGFDGHAIVGKLVKGTPPDFRQILPKKSDSRVKITVDRGSTLKALEAISIIASQKTKNIKLSVDANNPTPIALYAKDGSAREGRSPISGAVDSGGAVKCGFNADYLAEAIKDIDADEIEISLINDLSPVFLQAKGDNRENHFWVVMPMRL